MKIISRKKLNKVEIDIEDLVNITDVIVTHSSTKLRLNFD